MALVETSRESASPSRMRQLATEIERAAATLGQHNIERRQADRLRSIKARLNEQRLQIAILGQFKRGKSSLLNAVLGAPVLPVAVVPLTAVPIFISWSPNPFARVTFSTGRSPERFESSEPKEMQEFLAQFVAEERNPQNQLGVEHVALVYPSALLSNGIVLIDTPGVGSSHRHNTETALRVLPECDAAIFVISADPPITETEIDYLKQIKPRAARIVFVLNKMDYLDGAEQRLAIEFLRKVLSDNSLIRQSDEIVGLSARDALAAKLRNDPDKLQRSGIQKIEKDLIGGITREKDALLERAIRCKTIEIIAQATAAIELRIKAMTLPLEELESRAEKFENALLALREQHLALRDLLEGDRRRLAATLEAQIEALRGEAHSVLKSVTGRALSNDDAELWEQNAKSAISKTIDEFFANARERFRKAFTEETLCALASHHDRLRKVLNSIRDAAASAFDLSFTAEEPDQPFELGEDPYWVTDADGTTLLPNTGRLLDRFVSLKTRRRRVLSRLLHQTDELVIRNTENLRWAILRGIAETVGTAADGIEERLGDVIFATKGVIDHTLARRTAHSTESETEVSALRHAIKTLGEVREALREHEDNRS